MHRIDVDASQTIIRGRENYNSEMRYSMSLEFGRELG